MKVHCPKHKDSVPSCEVYEDSGWCFSGCGRVELSEIGMEGLVPEVKPVEDVEQKLKYIAGLAVDVFRGFPFPYDHRGFYVVWGNAPYYKQRMLNPGDGPKYKGPSGHKPPIFWARNEGVGTLLVVEGELEALSVAAVIPQWDVLSPGSASEFGKPALTKACTAYRTVIVCTDSDAPGVKAAKELAANLLYKVPKLVVFYKDKERDFNKILTTDGQDSLRDEIGRRLQDGVCWENSGP